MKTVPQIILGFILIVSCSTRENERNPDNAVKVESEINVSETENIDSMISNEIIHDSLDLLNFREDAFSFARNSRTKRLNEQISEQGKVTIFQNNEEYLYLRFNLRSWMQKIEFYKIVDEEPNLIWEEVWEDMTFIGDTIRDVNGDNQYDILTNFYPSSGCCRRNSFWLRLYDNQTQSFTEKIRMINPTFYPKEKIVRGVNYGHPGEVPIYKIKWKGNKLDTVEYIYPFPKEKGKFLKTKKYEIYPERENPPKGKIIYSLPEEYENIESIEWFLDY